MLRFEFKELYVNKIHQKTNEYFPNLNIHILDFETKNKKDIYTHPNNIFHFKLKIELINIEKEFDKISNNYIEFLNKKN